MNTNGIAKKPRKERAQLSCTFCRHRKLKCDRRLPCGNCVKRRQASTCNYAHPPKGNGEKSSPIDVQTRMRHLESLVLSLMAGKGTKALETPSESADGNSMSNSNEFDTASDLRLTEQALQAFGKLDVSGVNTEYVGNEHWASILDDIAEVKKHLESEAKSPDEGIEETSENFENGPDLLLGWGKAPLREEMLEILPPKAELDRLVTNYFSSPDPFTILLHRPTFSQDYEKFWANPSSASITWVGLLFAIITQTTLFQLGSGDLTTEDAEQIEKTAVVYRRATAQCLVISNYTKPVRWTLEAMIIYHMSEYIRSKEAQMGEWMVLGIIVRLAMRMGYHRDPRLFPQIPPLHGEMRRRAWAMIVQLDLLYGIMFGLPHQIRAEMTDTELPGNYFDEDLHENMDILPPPRPDSEYTPASYHITKGRISMVLSQIADSLSETRSPSYEHVLRLDGELKRAYEAMPALLRAEQPDGDIKSQPELLFRRLTLDTLYHKCRCLLHRNYIVPARCNDRYAFSFHCAITSAKVILQHQSTIDEISAGRQLGKDRWMLTSITSSDFMLAAMVICLSIDSLTQADSELSDDDLGGGTLEFINLIERSYNIWNKWKRVPELANRRSEKACEALGIMLRKIRSRYATHGAAYAPEVKFVDMPPAPLIASQPPPLSHDGSGVSSTEIVFQQTPDSSAAAYFPELAPVTDWMDAPQDINWDEWDDLFQPRVNAMDISVWQDTGF